MFFRWVRVGPRDASGVNARTIGTLERPAHYCWCRERNAPRGPFKRRQECIQTDRARGARDSQLISGPAPFSGPRRPRVSSLRPAVPSLGARDGACGPAERAGAGRPHPRGTRPPTPPVLRAPQRYRAAFVCARARPRASGRDGAGPAGGRIPGREGSRTPTGTARARPPGQPAPASAAAGFRHRGRRAATLDPSEQVAGGLPPPPGCSVASCRPLEEPARAGGITQGTCGLEEEEAGRWLRDVSQLTQSVCASVSWNLQWGWL